MKTEGPGTAAPVNCLVVNPAPSITTLCLKKRDPDIIDCNFGKD